MLLEKYENEFEFENDYLIEVKHKFVREMSGLRHDGEPVIYDVRTMSHITTSTRKLGGRGYDEERTKYILNIPRIIRNLKDDNYIVEYRLKRNRRVILNLNDSNEYIIVLKKKENGFHLVTGYDIRRESTLTKLIFKEILSVDKKYEKKKATNFHYIEVLDKRLYISANLYKVLASKNNIKLALKILREVIISGLDEAFVSTSRYKQHIKKSDYKKAIFIVTDDNIDDIFISKYYEEWQKFSELVENKSFEFQSELPTNFSNIYNEFMLVLCRLASLEEGTDFYSIEEKFEQIFSYTFIGEIKRKYAYQFPKLIDCIISKDIDKAKKYNDEFVSKKNNLDIIYFNEDGEVCLNKDIYDKYVHKYIMDFFKDFEEQVIVNYE